MEKVTGVAPEAPQLSPDIVTDFPSTVERQLEPYWQQDILL